MKLDGAMRRRSETTRRGFLSDVAKIAAGVGLGAAGSLWSGRATPAAAQPGNAAVSVVVPGDFPTMDPMLHTQRYGFWLNNNVFDALVTRRPDLSIVPHLAESYRIVNENTWEFKLRRGVKFHNGDPLTADDVKFTFDRVLNPATKSPRRGEISAIDRVEKVDDYTVRLITKSPYPVMLARLTLFWITPMNYIQARGADHFAEVPVGSGPYKFVKWVKGQSVTIEANESYWGGAPKVENMVWPVIPEMSSALAALLAGQTDIVSGIPPDQVSVIQGKPKVRILLARDLRETFIVLGDAGTPGSPLAKKAVRQALNYATDWDKIVKSIFKGYYTRTNGPLTPDHFGYDAALKPYPYDPGKAKQLLAEAGYGGGFRTKALYPNYDSYGDVTVAVQADWANVGVTLELEGLAIPTFASLTQMSRQGKPMFFQDWGSYYTYDADGLLYSFFGKGQPFDYWSNPEVERLVEEGRSTLDKQKRLAVYRRLQEVVHEEAPWVFGYQWKLVWGVANRVQWTPRPDNLVNGWEMSVG
jgi:peptide/nickel transport system substrate-binding protein